MPTTMPAIAPEPKVVVVDVPDAMVWVFNAVLGIDNGELSTVQVQ